MSKNITGPRIGLVGCGLWGRYILRDLVQLDCETWVVAKNDASINNAQTNHASHIVSSIDELPEDLDGYVVAVPTSVHGQVLKQLIERGRPIYVEKPLTNSVTEATALLEAAGDLIFVMDKWRYHAGINALADIVRSGEMGDIQSLRLRRNGWGNPHDDVDSIWVLLPHDLSITLHILGHLPELRNAVNLAGQAKQATGISLQLGSKPVVLIEVSSKSIIRERSVVAEFSGGVAMMADSYADHILIQRGTGLEKANNPEAEKRIIATDMPLLLELKAFVDYLHGGDAPLSPASDGVLIVKTIATARRMAGID